MSLAVAVPDGKRSCSTRIVWRRSGTAKKIPKYVSAAHHTSSCSGDSVIGPPSAAVSIASAGTMPTKPPASGIVAVATPIVWISTFSRGPNGAAPGRDASGRTSRKPTSAHWIEPIVTQPVCRPKYMLVKHSTVPTSRPTTTPRT